VDFAVGVLVIVCVSDVSRECEGVDEFRYSVTGSGKEVIETLGRRVVAVLVSCVEGREVEPCVGGLEIVSSDFGRESERFGTSGAASSIGVCGDGLVWTIAFSFAARDFGEVSFEGETFSFWVWV
jgi:hypothetical protein